MTYQAHLAARMRTRTAGAALLELALVVPIFLLCFSGTYWLWSTYVAKQTATLAARACALTWAEQGCRGPRPFACALEPLDDGVSTPVVPASIATPDTQTGETSVFTEELLSRVPRIRAELSGLERLSGVLAAALSRSVPRPPMLGGGNATVLSHSYALCNSVPTTVIPVRSADIFCGFMPCGFAGCEAAQADPAIGCQSANAP